MSPLDPLAPDQRAVVTLILQQGRTYDEIATLLGIPVAAVRARAQAGLAALAPANGLPAEITAPIADYLLGQQPDRDAEATRGLLAESAPVREWATGVAAQLADAAPRPLPPIPGAAHDAAEPAAPAETAEPSALAEPSAPAQPAETSAAADAPAASAPADAPDVVAPRPRPLRDEPAGDGPPASSKLGGVLLIGAVLAVVGVVLFFVLRGGDDDPSAEQPASASATATATPSAEPQVTDQITLRPPGGGDAQGTMTVYLQGEQLLFAIQGQNLPPSSENAAYAVWLTGPGSKARRLGFTNPVGEDGQLGIQGPGESDVEAFPQLYATYERVVVSQERTEDAKRPSRIVLSGRLPAGR